MAPYSTLGGAPVREGSKNVIRLILRGCVNRPFFHISVQELLKTPEEPVIEQIGNYDPLPNKYNEKLVAINFQRLEYWLRKGAEPTPSVSKLLGLSGYFPVHPQSFSEAYNRRKSIIKELENLKIEAAKFSSVKSEPTEELSSHSDSDSDSNSNSNSNSNNNSNTTSSDSSEDESTDVSEESKSGNDLNDEPPKK